MSNLPPEHRNPAPDDEPNPEEMTGSFPAVDEQFLPPSPPPPMPMPPTGNPAMFGESNDGMYPPAPEVNQAPPAPEVPPSADPTATGQFPAFGGQETQQPSTAYFVDRNTGEQQIIEDNPNQRFEPPAPNVAPSVPFEQPVRHETAEAPQVGPQFPPAPAIDGFESKNPTMQTGIEMPDVLIEPTGPATGVADAVELPPVPHPNIGIPAGDDGPAAFDESDIDGYLDTDDIDADLPARVRKKLAKKAQPDSKFQQLRNEKDSDSGWSYLAILGLLFLLLAGFAWGCQRVSDADQSAARNAQLASEVNVTVRVGGDQVSIVGALPDEETANELVALVAEHYDSNLITNALTVNPAISSGDSVLQITGQAQTGDARPEELQSKLGASFDVPVASNTVQYGALPENLVAVSVQVNGASVVVSGSVPDQAKLDLVKGAAESVWGAENADTSALVIGDVIWSGGRVSLTGDIPLGSSEPQQFAEQIRLEGIFVDTGTNDDDIATATPDELKAAVAQRFEVAPISFEAGKQALTDADEKTLDGIAELLLALPEDEKITIVGHSDNGGESSAARELAAQRARIVWAYLTQKKGISDSVDNEGSATDSTSKITIRFG